MTHRRTRAPIHLAAVPLTLLTLLALVSFAAAQPGTAAPSGASAAALDAGTARAELRYVADTVLAVHPAMTDADARQAFQSALADESAGLGDAPTPGDVAMAAQRLLATLGDAHTTSAPQTVAERAVPLVFFAASDGIVVSPLGTAAAGLPDTGRLLRLGTLAPADVLTRLARLVPGNAAWVRYHGMQMLNAASVLSWLGAVQGGAVDVVVQGRDGRIRAASVPLVPVAGLKGAGAALQSSLERAVGLAEPWQQQGSSYRWRIDGASGTGIFWLTSCVDSPEYRAAVDAFFRAVRDRGLDRVVLDLRFDGGGNSAVTDAWLAHLPARKVRNFGVAARISAPVLAQRGVANLAAGLLPKDHDGLSVMQRAGSVSPVPAAEPIFTGRVIVVVNGATFSSAGMVATLLSDNGLAVVAGEPMGAEPSGYGDILRFRTPTLQLPFTVSYKRFDRPLADRGARFAVDLPLPLTVNDLLSGRNVLTSWLRALPR